jgi:hypothetical protein
MRADPGELKTETPLPYHCHKPGRLTFALTTRDDQIQETRYRLERWFLPTGTTATLDSNAVVRTTVVYSTFEHEEQKILTVGSIERFQFKLAFCLTIFVSGLTEAT